METGTAKFGTRSRVAFPALAAFSAFLSLTALPFPAHAGTILLQTVDLSDQDMSTEGGEVRLYRLTNSGLGRCKIEAVHYGEMGRSTRRFIFASRLNYAALRDYAYSAPITAGNNPRTRLTREVLLASPEGQQLLPAEFETYKAFFDQAKLAQCAGRGRN